MFRFTVNIIAAATTAMAITPRTMLKTLILGPATNIAVGPSAPPIIPMDAACGPVKPRSTAKMKLPASRPTSILSLQVL